MKSKHHSVVDEVHAFSNDKTMRAMQARNPAFPVEDVGGLVRPSQLEKWLGIAILILSAALIVTAVIVVINWP